jgi:hypothetical protein
MPLGRGILAVHANPLPLDGCPMFAKAYMGRKRRGDPGFLPRGATNIRVCGFHQGKPHGVHQRHQAQQEIRGEAPSKIYRFSVPSTEPAVPRTPRSGPQSPSTATLSFVIPSEADLSRLAVEGSAVPRTDRGEVGYDTQTKLSSRPERSAVERSAVFHEPSWVPLVPSAHVPPHDLIQPIKPTRKRASAPAVLLSLRER